MGRRDAKFRKLTFWNELRVKYGYSYQDISDILDKDATTIGKWFTGQSIPPRKHSDELCDLFGIDHDTGYSEFVEFHTMWKSSRKSKNTESMPMVEIGFESDRDPEPKNEQPIALNSTNIKMLKTVYGKFSFEDYENLRTLMLEGDDPREILYGKISFEEYIEFLNAIK